MNRYTSSNDSITFLLEQKIDFRCKQASERTDVFLDPIYETGIFYHSVKNYQSLPVRGLSVSLYLFVRSSLKCWIRLTDPDVESKHRRLQSGLQFVFPFMFYVCTLF